MTLQEIEKKLAILQPKLVEIVDPKIIAIINEQQAMLESSCSLISKLTDTVQGLKDEINRLKGEDGKARIKPNVGGVYSTEEERKAAEAPSKPPATSFALTNSKLTALREKRIPEDVLDSLSEIKNKKFSSEKDFMESVANLIGPKDADTYREILLKYSCYRKRDRKSKVERIEIDRTEKCEIDKSTLPDDARPCGHEENIVQDLIIKRDNVKFVKEVYYSPSQQQTFMAKVPIGYEGGYGPNIKTEIIGMKYVNVMSEPNILGAMRSYGVVISPSYISDRLTSPVHMSPFIDEKDYLFRMALEASPYHQIDDTGCRVNGVNQYVHILCNGYYTAFFTMPRKDRLTVLDILRNFAPRRFLFNDDTFRFLEMFNVSDKNIVRIKGAASASEYDEDGILELLSGLFPNSEKGKNTRIRITEAAAIAHYHQDHENGVVNVLVADDAPQFKLLTAFLGLCWVHIGRHFKKLNPIVPRFQEKLKKFQDEFWTYYGKLRKYQDAPDEVNSKALEIEFDKLFSTKTGYPELDERIGKTKGKKNELLLALKRPEVPLHNNRSENGARTQKRRQDVSLQTKSKAGTIAKDAMMSNVETCAKLGVNPRDFIKDRILRQGKIPKLGDMIKERFSP